MNAVGGGKLVALLAWYDESPTMLAACVSSLSKLPVDHLVALDGGYRLFPGQQTRTLPPSQNK